MHRMAACFVAAALLASGCVLRKGDGAAPSERPFEATFSSFVPSSPGEPGRQLLLRPTCASAYNPLADCAAMPPIWQPIGNASTTLTSPHTWFIATVRDCNHHTVHFGFDRDGPAPRLHFSFARTAAPLQVTAGDGRILEPQSTRTEMACTQGV